MGKLSHRESNELAQVSSWRATCLLPSELQSLHLPNGNKVKKVKVLVAWSCPTLCDTMDCSPSGSSVHGDSPGKNTGVGCHSLLQGIFPPQGWNSGLLHYRQILYHLSHWGSPSPPLMVGWRRLEEAMRPPPGRKKTPDAARNNYCSGRVGWSLLPFPCYR